MEGYESAKVEYEKAKLEFKQKWEEAKNTPLSKMRISPEKDLRISQVFMVIWVIIFLLYMFVPIN